MKILVCVNTMRVGGAERVAAQLAKAWSDRGDRITLVMTYSGDGGMEIRVGGKIKTEILADNKYAGMGLLGRYVSRIMSLRGLIKSEKPDCVVSLLTNVNVMAILSTVGMGIPVIVSERVHPALIRLPYILSVLRRMLYPKASMVVVLSPVTIKWLREKVPGARGVIIPNHITNDLEVNIQCQEPPGDRGGRNMLLATGRFVPQKQFLLLVEAFSELANDNPGWDLYIIGDGPEREKVSDRIGVLGLKERIFIPGRVGNVSQWYRAAHIFALSSRYEGFPNALAEAMAHGCPAVSYDCDTGPRDIIRDGVDGLLVRPVGDVAALAEALGRLMGDDELRKRMAARAPEVLERYSLGKILALWDRVFEEVGARRRIS